MFFVNANASNYQKWCEAPSSVFETLLPKGRSEGRLAEIYGFEVLNPEIL